MNVYLLRSFCYFCLYNSTHHGGVDFDVGGMITCDSSYPIIQQGLLLRSKKRKRMKLSVIDMCERLRNDIGSGRKAISPPASLNFLNYLNQITMKIDDHKPWPTLVTNRVPYRWPTVIYATVYSMIRRGYSLQSCGEREAIPDCCNISYISRISKYSVP